MINFFTAGESHNKAIVTFIEGIPAGLKISLEKIKQELLRRRSSYGRSQRQIFEEDKFEFVSGVRYNETVGSPVCVIIWNKDYREEEFVLQQIPTQPHLTPRPGHADLAGVMKYLRQDIKDISERASARETVGRVVAGSICKQLLEKFGIFIGSFVVKIYNIEFDKNYITSDEKVLIKYHNLAEKSLVRFPDRAKEEKILQQINNTRDKKDTIGGEFVVFACGVPTGLGSHVQWYQRLNAKIAYYLFSIPSVKSVEFGLGKSYSNFFGSQVHDKIYYDTKKGFYRGTNNAGGIEGGISNGQPIIVRCTLKPIPTLYNPLDSVNIKTKKSSKAEVIRSDICVVPSAAVIAEAMLAICLANEVKIKFGGDSMKEILQNYKSFLQMQRRL